MKRLLHTLSIVFSFLSACLLRTDHLHKARFARFYELSYLITSALQTQTCLLLGKHRFGAFLRIRPTQKRRELGNMLICAPTRAGKGLLAVSQLLTWKGSVIVNDIKGDLFTQTAGYRKQLGKVYVLDPTGIGHRYDPLRGKRTEDELLSAATHLFYDRERMVG